jgi:hypothetical protein
MVMANCVVIKNSLLKEMTIYFEPSTDKFVLRPGDFLQINPKFETEKPIEIDYEENYVTVLIWGGQSADLFLNGSPLDSICSKFTW